MDLNEERNKDRQDKQNRDYNCCVEEGFLETASCPARGSGIATTEYCPETGVGLLHQDSGNQYYREEYLYVGKDGAHFANW